MKKKLLISSLIMVSCIFMTPMGVYADAQTDFLNDLAVGLTERWEDQTDTTTLSQEEIKTLYTKLVGYEYDKLEKYKDQQFEDAKFNAMAHAYIDALECQKNALDYVTDINTIYERLWSAGYDVRSLLLPDFVDSYGLDVDETQMKILRDNKAAITSGVPYTITVTDTTSDTDSSDIDTSDVNTGAEQQPIEIYNNDGIKITISKFEKTSYGSARVYMDVVNLNHKDLAFLLPNSSVLINGVNVNAGMYSKVTSGKTGSIFFELYGESTNGIAIDDIQTLDFKVEIDTTTGSMSYYKDETDEIYLDVNDGVLTQRVVYTDKETIQKVQQLLTNLGYDSGSTDGIPGKLTNSAILQFEKDHGLEENTDITPALIQALEQAVGEQ